MRSGTWRITCCVMVVAATAALMVPVSALAQDVSSSSSSTSDRWLHVRVTSSDSKNETVKVNVPLEMAEKILPAINNKDRLHNGKIRLNEHELNGVDLRTLLDAVRSAKDGEYVTVQSNDSNVRVAKQNGYMFVHVTEKEGHDAEKRGKAAQKSQVDVKVPVKVVEALFSAGQDELDVVAALKALSAHGGDTELVSVKSDDSTVRVWLDSKNISD